MLGRFYVKSGLKTEILRGKLINYFNELFSLLNDKELGVLIDKNNSTIYDNTEYRVSDFYKSQLPFTAKTINAIREDRGVSNGEEHFSIFNKSGERKNISFLWAFKTPSVINSLIIKGGAWNEKKENPTGYITINIETIRSPFEQIARKDLSSFTLTEKTDPFKDIEFVINKKEVISIQIRFVDFGTNADIGIQEIRVV